MEETANIVNRLINLLENTGSQLATPAWEILIDGNKTHGAVFTFANSLMVGICLSLTIFGIWCIRKSTNLKYLNIRTINTQEIFTLGIFVTFFGTVLTCIFMFIVSTYLYQMLTPEYHAVKELLRSIN